MAGVNVIVPAAATAAIGRTKPAWADEQSLQDGDHRCLLPSDQRVAKDTPCDAWGCKKGREARGGGGGWGW